MARQEAMVARAILLGLVLGEALVATALWLGWWPAALVLHLGCCVALIFLPRPGADAAGWPGAVLRVVTALLPALGPAPAVGALLALASGAPRGLRAAAAPLPEDPLEARLDAIAAARDIPGGLLLEALGDVLRWGTPPQKARALDLAAAGFRPGGEALLRLAMSDPDPAVRARAEAVRPEAERRLLLQAEELRAASRGGDEAVRALARHLDRAAYSGLLDPARAATFREEAAGLWRSLTQRNPEDAEAQAALGRDLLALGDLPAARAALEAALARSVATPAVIGWLAECLFRARDFAAMDALLAHWRPVLEMEAAGNAPLSPVWRLWLAGEAK